MKKISRRSNGMGTIFQRGKRFWLRIIIDGELYQKALVDPETGKPAETKTEAELIRERVVQDIRQSKMEPRRDREYDNLSELFDLYFQAEGYKWAKARQVEYDRRRKLFENIFEKVSEITFDKLSKFVKERLEQIPQRFQSRKKGKPVPRMSPSTLRKEINELKRVLNWAIESRKLNFNPVTGFRMPKEPENRTRILSDRETDRLLQTIKEPRWDGIRLIVYCALFLGMRRQEVFLIKLEDVKKSERAIRLERTKTGKKRTIPIPTEIWKLIVEQIERAKSMESEYLFPSSVNSKKPYNNIKISFKNLLKEAKIENFTFHDLRHCAATRLYKAKGDVRSTMKILGHSSFKTSEKYINLSLEEDRDNLQTALNELSDKL